MLNIAFTIFLGVLSSVLSDLGSLGATVRGQAGISKKGDLSKRFWVTRELQPHETLIGESSPKGLYLNTKTRTHSKVSKLQCWTPHAKPSAKQKHNTTLPTRKQTAHSHTMPIETIIYTTGHSTALKDLAPSTRTQSQETPTRKLSQGTGPNPLTGGRPHR